MPEAIAVLEVDNPHFTVRLYENLLKIDLKGSFKNEIEEALENKPILKETFGSVLGIFIHGLRACTSEESLLVLRLQVVDWLRVCLRELKF